MATFKTELGAITDQNYNKKLTFDSKLNVLLSGSQVIASTPSLRVTKTRWRATKGVFKTPD